MNIKEVIDYMMLRPYTLRMGARNVANRLHCDDNLVREARAIINRVKTEKKQQRIPKILLFDLETAPMRAYVWSRWKQDITLDKTISESFIICWSAKWLYSNEVMSDTLTKDEVLNGDDKRICISLWKLVNEADVIVAHNARHADIPWMNSRFILNNLPPTKPYITIDTLEIARKQFGFSSNKLDALAGYFNIPHKLHTDFTLWKECMEGNQESLNYMLEYNMNDVKILEEVYLKLAPWIKGGPNMNVLTNSDIPVCACCGSEAIELIPKEYYYTSVGKYELFRCKDCEAVTRGRFSIAEKKVTKAVSLGK